MATGYSTLRSFLNPAIAGPKTDALLSAIGTGDDYLNENAKSAVADMFLVSASGDFLDVLANNVAVIRPNNIGISDDSLRNIARIFIGYKNVNNSINELLKVYFSLYQTNAYTETEITETYALVNNDDLIIQIDDDTPVTVYFNTAYFTNIATASAVEVSDYLNNLFLDLKINAIATTVLDTDSGLNKLRIVSKTQGAQGAVAVLGGSAQKALRFPTFIDTEQDATTVFNITQSANSIFRYTWSGGTDPNFDLLLKDDQVIITGSEFNSNNIGTFTVKNVVSGNVNNSYFEVYNESGVAQSGVTLVHSNHLQFYRPEDFTIIRRDSYAAIFETTPGEINLTIPAATSIIDRTPTTGGAYLSDVKYTFTLTGAVSFTLGEIVSQSATRATGIVLSVSGTSLVLGDVQEDLALFATSGNLYGEQSGVTGTYTSYPTLNYQRDFNSCYIFNLNSYVLTQTSSTLSVTITQGSNNVIMTVANTGGFPSSGYLVIDLGMDNEEDLIPYLAVLNTRQIQLDSSYTFQHKHGGGADVTILDGKNKFTPDINGGDLGAYLTDVANARQSFVNYLNQIKAGGIFVSENVIYPDDYGLPNSGTEFSFIKRVYGDDSTLDTDGFLSVAEA